MGRLRTTIFEYAEGLGLKTDAKLAARMGLSPSHVWRVRHNKRAIGRGFQEGAYRAFGEVASALFYFERDGEKAS